MKKILVLILFVSLMLGYNSCSDYLDIIPEGVASMDNAFSNRTNAEKFLYTCYSYLPRFDHAASSVGFLGGDEHWLIPKGTGFIDGRVGSLNCWEIGRGSQNNNNPYLNYWDGGDYGGTNLWVGIRDCNIFLENIDKPKDLSSYERVRWVAEVTFLKAYYHFYLMQLYGPIPIMDENVEVNASIDDVRKFREPFDDVVDYIVKTIDGSIENLPLFITDEGLEMGRITQPIALAVKAQTLLFAASPLMNGNTDYANVKDSRGLNLFPTAVDQTKWQRAADAALAAIQTAESAGHEIYKFEEALKISGTTRTILSIGEAVTERWNKEIVWGSTRSSNELQTLAMTRIASDRAYYEARKLLAPTLQIAEQFYSSNGVPIEEDNSNYWSTNYSNRYSITTIPDEGINKYILEVGGETAMLHLNRELRFYSSISFDRGTWYMSGYANDEAALSKPHLRAAEYSGMTGSEDYSITGYLNKKIISYRSSLTSSNWQPYRYAFPIIRLADLYLMYAEALNESHSSPDQAVYEYIDKVRERAGLAGVVESWSLFSKYPTKPTTKDGMRDIIRKERLNELAMEGKRFWDLRRWKIELPSAVKGWNIKGATAQEFYRVTTIFERTRYTYKDFLWPLKVETIQKNPNLVQNPGWN